MPLEQRFVLTVLFIQQSPRLTIRAGMNLWEELTIANEAMGCGARRPFMPNDTLERRFKGGLH